MSVRPAASLPLLAALTALGFCSLHMVIAVLPVLASAFDSVPSQVAPVVTLYLAGIAIGQLVYGPVSDRFGRRPVLLAGLAMYLGGTLLGAVAWTLPALIAGRVLQALGACAGIVLGRAIIRDVYDRDGAARALALVMMVMTLAPAICPAIGAYLALWFGWQSVFVLLGVLGVAVLAMTAAWLVETNRAARPLDLIGMAGSYAVLLHSPSFLGFALCSAFTSASWFTFTASAPYLLSDLGGEPPSTYGLMILVPMAAYMLGNGFAARFAVRLGTIRLFLWGLLVSLASGVVMALWCLYDGYGAWMLFVPMALSSIGNGMSQPPALASGLSVYPRIAGAASGLLGFLQMAVSAAGTFVVGMLPPSSAWGTIAVIAACMAAAMACGAFAVRQPVAQGMTGDNAIETPPDPTARAGRLPG